MKRSKRFEPIVELAEKREKEAVRILGQCQAKKRHLYEKAETLKKYRNDYSARLIRAGEEGLSARQLLDYRSFLGKLNQAIGDEEKRMREVDLELSLRRKTWEEALNRKVSLQKIEASWRAAEAKIIEQREEREADDRAARSTGEGWSADPQEY